VAVTASIVLFQNHSDKVAESMRGLLDSPLVTRVVLFDNSPTDELRKLADRDPRLVYIHCPGNIGFGAGHNRAFQKCEPDSEFHILLNPDVSFQKEVISDLVDFMKANPTVGVITPEVRSPDGQLQLACKRFPTPLDLIARRFFPRPLQWLLRTRMARYEVQDRDLSLTMEMPCIGGCFLMVRSSIFVAVGGYDEEFFMYLEDYDLQRRIWRTHSVVYRPTVTIKHDFGRGSYKNRKLLKYHIQSAFHFFNKWGWFRDPGRVELNKRANRQWPELPKAER